MEKQFKIKVINDLQGIKKKIEESEGLWDNLDDAVNDLDVLMKDIEEEPEH